MPRRGGKSNHVGPRSILAVSDLSRASDAVLRTAARIALRAGAELHVVHAMGLLGISLGEALVLLHETHIRQTRDALEEQLARALPRRVRPASYGLDYQSAHLAVRHRAREIGAELVVIGPREPRMPGIRPGDLSLAEAAAHAGTPVLVVRAPLPWPPRRVLLPVNRSTLAAGVLDSAGAWLRRTFATEAGPAPARTTALRVVHVARQLAGWREVAPLLDAELRRLEDGVAGEMGIRVRRSVRWGASASEQILGLATADRAELILLSALDESRGCEAEDRETTRRVLREARCSVLLLPGAVASAGPTPGGGLRLSPQVDVPALEDGDEAIAPYALSEAAAD